VIELEVPRCAGIDIGKAEVVVAVHTPDPRGGRRRQLRSYPTMTWTVPDLVDSDHSGH
jgi:hypothetical protein